MQKPQSAGGKFTKTSLETLKTGSESFRTAGDDIKNAKHHNNVIAEPIFNIELDQVSIKILVQSLGT